MKQVRSSRETRLARISGGYHGQPAGSALPYEERRAGRLNLSGNSIYDMSCSAMPAMNFSQLLNCIEGSSYAGAQGKRKEVSIGINHCYADTQREFAVERKANIGQIRKLRVSVAQRQPALSEMQK